MTSNSYMAGDVNSFMKKQYSGYSLIEMTIVISVIISLITVLSIATQAYVNGADEAACVINQDIIHTVIVSQLNMRAEDFVPGVDYFATPDVQEAFGDLPECPAVGSYTAFFDPATGQLVITCVEHGHTR